MSLSIKILIVAFLITSCGQDENKQKELELKERELTLKEKELDLKEKERNAESMTSSVPSKTDTPKDVTSKQNVALDYVDAINYQGEYSWSSSTSTANNTYPDIDYLSIKRNKNGSYKWTITTGGYQHGYEIYGDGKQAGNTAEFYLRGLKDGSFSDYEKQKGKLLFTMKKQGNKYLTKFYYENNYVSHYTKD